MAKRYDITIKSLLNKNGIALRKYNSSKMNPRIITDGVEVVQGGGVVGVYTNGTVCASVVESIINDANLDCQVYVNGDRSVDDYEFVEEDTVNAPVVEGADKLVEFFEQHGAKVDETIEVDKTRYILNYEESKDLYESGSKWFVANECYGNVYQLISNNNDIWHKVNDGDYRICYGYWFSNNSIPVYVRHAFLLNDKNEVIDVTQFCYDEHHIDSNYIVAKSFNDIETYLDAIVENNFYPALDRTLSPVFMRYELSLMGDGLICLG